MGEESGPTPVFHLGFDDGLTPESPAGQSAANDLRPQTTFPAEYRDGVRGRALFLGAKDHLLTIPLVERYLSGDEATLVFWIKKPDGGQGQFNLLGGAFGNAGQTWWQGALRYDTLSLPMLARHWQMIAISCDRKGRSVFYDGVKVAEGPPRQPQGNLVFGDRTGPTEKSGQAQYLLDEVMIFDRALNEKEIFDLFLQTAAVAREPVLRMLPRQAPVTIDGQVTPAEWNGAARAGGFVGEPAGFAAETPTWVWACYDEDNLYLALVSETPKYALERVEDTIGMRGYVSQHAEQPGPAFLDDDRFRIVLAHDYANPQSTWELEFNNRGVAVARQDGKEVATDARLATATDVQAGWQAEVAIPWRGLGGKPVAGTTLGFNAVRIWKALQQTRDQWAWGVRRADRSAPPFPLGKLIVGQPSEIAARLVSVGQVTEGKVALAAEFENRGDAIRTLNLVLASARTTAPLRNDNLCFGDTSECRAVDTISLMPGERKTVEFAPRLTDPATRWLTLEVGADGRELMRYQFPVFLAALAQVKVAHYPSRELYRVQPDLSRIPPGDLAGVELEATLFREGGRDSLARGQLSAPKSANEWIDISTQGLPGGTYRVRYAVKRAGAELMSGEIPFRKRPLESFAWYGNDIGKRDVVPPPFTPIRRAGGVLRVWHREYRIENALLPAQIINTVPEWAAGWVVAADLETPGSLSPTLASPMRLVVTDKNRKPFASSDGSARVHWDEEKNTRVSWSAQQDVGPARITAQCFMEYDGFMWVDLTLTAQDEIAAAAIELPFRSAWATLANYLEYHPRYNGGFPDKREHDYQAPVPVWIGNEVGGTQWIVNTWHTGEHDFKHDRRLKDKTPGLVLERKGETCLMTVVLANTPVRKGDRLRLRFGFITTPTKPFATNRLVGRASRFRSITYSPYWNIAAHEFDPSHAIGGLGRTTDIPGDPLVNSGTYATIGRLRDNAPDIEYWADDFMGYPRTRQLNVSWGRAIYDACVSSAAYRDYYVWWIAAEQARRRRVAGSYYDTDVCAGGASVLEGRELVKRIALAFLESEDATAIQFHQSGMWFGGWQFSFNDSHLDGENFVSLLTKAKPGYHHHYPIDAFRAQLNGYQFGIPCATLDQFARSGAIPATPEAWAQWGSAPVDFFMALCYLHYDVTPAPSWAWQPFVEPWTAAAQESGLLRTRLPHDRFLPYWTQTVTTFPAGVYGSFYVVTDARRVVLVMANYNEQALTLSLPLDLARLGYRPGEKVQARAVAPGPAQASLAGNTLTVTVGKAGGTMVILEGAQ